MENLKHGNMLIKMKKRTFVVAVMAHCKEGLTCLFLMCMLMLLTACDRQEEVQQVSYNERVAPDGLLEHEGSSIGQDLAYKFAMVKDEQNTDAQQVFIKYLSRVSGHAFKLVNLVDDTRITEQLGDDAVQFALLDIVSLIPAISQYGLQPIATGLNAEHKGDLQSFFIVSANSPLKQMSDIRGRVLALGRQNSLSSALIPLVTLASSDVLLSDLEQLNYTGSDKKCVNALLGSTADVCGVSAAFAEPYIQSNQVKLLGTSAYYSTYSIVSNLYVEEDVQQAVLEAVLKLSLIHQRLALNGSIIPAEFAPTSSLEYEVLNDVFVQLNMKGLQH